MPPAATKTPYSLKNTSMTPDEIERTVQFLLSHQAQTAADMTMLQGQVQQVT